MTIRQKLSQLPQIDECLKSPYGQKWLESYYRKTVIRSIREIVDSKRKEILKGADPEISIEAMAADIEKTIIRLSSYNLRSLINASGVVIHTNLGRAILSDKAIENVTAAAGSYSNLEYEIAKGKRGKRYSHILLGQVDMVALNPFDRQSITKYRKSSWQNTNGFWGKTRKYLTNFGKKFMCLKCVNLGLNQRRVKTNSNGSSIT